MRIFIETNFHAPTDYLGARIEATTYVPGASWVKTTVPYRHESESRENHLRAAEALIERLGGYQLTVEGIERPTGYGFVAES